LPDRGLLGIGQPGDLGQEFLEGSRVHHLAPRLERIEAVEQSAEHEVEKVPRPGLPVYLRTVESRGRIPGSNPGVESLDPDGVAVAPPRFSRAAKYRVPRDRMHPEARHFLDFVRRHLAARFRGDVLDVGSGDINGTNRGYFPTETCRYTGCDLVAGPNVDVVSPCHELPFGPASFDVVISSECLEHDMHWRKTVGKIVEMVRPGGLFVMTCATTGRAEHGTLRTRAGDSFSTMLGDDEAWQNYYGNLTEEDLRGVVAVEDTFSWARFHVNTASRDLYFAGVKRGGDEAVPDVPEYACA
jgi:SAM-dependent methyltransferase